MTESRTIGKRRPLVVAFDVVGTLFSLDVVRPRLTQAGLPDSALDLWFSRFLRDAMALDTAGVFLPFRRVAAATLEVLLAEHGAVVSPTTVEQVLQGFSELPPHPDVRPSFERLTGAGLRVVTLTNGSAEITERLLERATLDGFVERTISVDEVRHWKPHPEVYRHAAATLGIAPEQLGLVAAHAWDILGGDRVGLVTGWVARKEKKFHGAMGVPTVRGDSLTEVVDELLALPK